MYFWGDPGPCGVCGAAHSTCKGERDDSTGVGVTRGVIIRQLPQRDAMATPPAAPVQTSAGGSRPAELPAASRPAVAAKPKPSKARSVNP